MARVCTCHRPCFCGCRNPASAEGGIKWHESRSPGQVWWHCQTVLGRDVDPYAIAAPPCSGAGHVEWVKTLKELVLALAAYLRAHHAAGPVWNPAGRPLSQFKGA